FLKKKGSETAEKEQKLSSQQSKVHKLLNEFASKVCAL
ncbi:MAG: hypothetical protein QG632_785, partial [Candidatus Dependentiae bacterium]|nr:hypothetical protein [Candidatus Dependentiae bacterium]